MTESHRHVNKAGICLLQGNNDMHNDLDGCFLFHLWLSTGSRKSQKHLEAVANLSYIL